MPGVTLRTHDTRNIVQQKMATMQIDDLVAELVLGHALPGLKRVYSDPSAYLDQKRAALETWAAELARIVGDTPEAKIVPLKRKSRR